MSLTKNPTKPMMTNPVAVLDAIFQNSRESGLEHFFTSRIESLAKSRTGFTAMSATSIAVFRSGSLMREAINDAIEWIESPDDGGKRDVFKVRGNRASCR